MKNRFLSAVFFLILPCPILAQTQSLSVATQPVEQTPSVPRLIKFGSTLRDSSGNAVTGPMTVVFALYAAREGGAPVWQETQLVTADSTGRYNVLLGSKSVDGIPQDIFTSGEARWLGVQVEGTEEPRAFLVSVPYALKAVDAETLGGMPLSAFMLASPTNAAVSSLSTASQARTLNTFAAITGNGSQNFLQKIDASGTNLINSLLFDNGASVGLGTTTPDLAGQGNRTLTLFSPTQASAMEFGSGTTTNTGQVGVFGFVSTATTATGSDSRVAFFDALLDTSNPSYGGKLRFGTKPPGGTLTSRMVIDPLGNVGIGTSAPTTTLDVNGLVRAASGFKFGDGTTQTTAAVGGGGTVTAVSAGNGLQGGGSSGAVALSLVAPVTIANGGTGLSSVGSAGTFLRSNGMLFQSSAIQTSDLPTNIAFTNFNNNFTANQTINVAGSALTATGTGTNSIGVQGTSNDTGGVGVQGVNSAGCSAPGANATCGKLLAANNGSQNIFSVDTNGVRLDGPINATIGNDTTTGTTTNLLVKLTTAGKGIVTATGDVGGAVGVAGFNAGTVDKAWVALIGVTNCQFDNQTVSADYAVIGTAGQCHDAGASYPEGVQVLGRATQPNSGPGTVGQIYLFGSEARGVGAGKLSLPAIAFSNLGGKAVSAQGILDNNASATNLGWHAVSLLQGAAVKGLKICGTDNDTGGLIAATLYRKNYTVTLSQTAPEVIASISTTLASASATAQCFASVNLNTSIATIDNTTYAYYAEIQMTGFVQVMSVEIDH